MIETSKGNKAGDVLCDCACITLCICRCHQCNRICCPLASLSAAQKGKGRKHAGLPWCWHLRASIFRMTRRMIL
ncbi:hypothetical protein DFJ58DRAFT_670828 [Suillus subalutaceus]|uniref:uncharacterized protein n=1 Tax=Suillus subalutaceus TaxID=48586 RepID=UPI001B85E7CB|nr:uncharacterized protein DFJ58DRAFT_670828 [Suillus subalutaceus]KAG1833657.1 hypothetical protein DFJ58DRAFT_670828 [Suillus subalutaceus]